MDDVEAVIREFLVESRENLDQLDRDLVQYEREPANRGRVAGIFRTIHTIKGMSGFLNYTKLGAVAHAGESLLSHLRDGRLVLNAAITSALLALVDAIRELLDRIEATGSEGDGDYSHVIEAVTQHYECGMEDRIAESVDPIDEIPHSAF